MVPGLKELTARPQTLESIISSDSASPWFQNEGATEAVTLERFPTLQLMLRACSSKGQGHTRREPRTCYFLTWREGQLGTKGAGFLATSSLRPCWFQTEVRGLPGLGRKPGVSRRRLSLSGVLGLFSGPVSPRGRPPPGSRDTEMEPSPLLTTPSACRFPATPSHR